MIRKQTLIVRNFLFIILRLPLLLAKTASANCFMGML
jgi:hypothetical protein